jgi:hypothetical protein
MGKPPAGVWSPPLGSPRFRSLLLRLGPAVRQGSLAGGNEAGVLGEERLPRLPLPRSSSS